MQISTLSAQLGLRWEPVDWYWDATSVSYGLSLIFLSPRTDNRLRSLTNTGSIPSKSYIPDRLKQSKKLDNEHTNSLYSPSFPINFPQVPKFFHSVLPRKVYQVPVRMYSKSSQKTCQALKHITRQNLKTKFDCSFWKESLRSKEGTFFTIKEKWLELINVNIPPVIYHFFWHGAVF